MSEKSPLEKAIERQELVRKPFSMLVLIIILSFSFGALGVYTYKIRQELSIKDKKIISLKNSFEREKTGLLNEIKRLGTEPVIPAHDQETITSDTKTDSKTADSSENDKQKTGN